MVNHAALVQKSLHELTGRGRSELQRYWLRAVITDYLDSGRSNDLLALIAQQQLENVSGVYVHVDDGRGGLLTVAVDEKRRRLRQRRRMYVCRCI